MKKSLSRFLIFILASLGGAGVSAAAPVGRPLTPAYSQSAAAAVAPLYQNYLQQHPGLQIEAAQIGNITIIRFLVNGACSDDGCYTTALAANAQGGFRQVLVLRAPQVQYFPSKSPYPVLRINGIDWAYTFHSGYIADLKSAGDAFTATLRPKGATAQEINAALSASGWPANLPYLIHEVTPGGNAPATLLVAPDLTSPAGQQDCAADLCHLWFLVYRDGAWSASIGTTGTGLFAVLPADHSGVSRIGVGEQEGFNVYSWAAKEGAWKETGSTFANLSQPGAQ